MQILHAIKSGFKRFRDFSGRSTRAEFWGFVLFMVAGGVTAFYLDAFVLANSPSSLGLVCKLFLLLTVIPYFAVGTRRLNAMGKSGWWQIIPINLVLIPKLLAGYAAFDEPFVQARDWIFPGFLMGMLITAIIVQLLLITWYSQESENQDQAQSVHPEQLAVG